MGASLLHTPSCLDLQTSGRVIALGTGQCPLGAVQECGFVKCHGPALGCFSALGTRKAERQERKEALTQQNKPPLQFLWASPQIFSEQGCFMPVFKLFHLFKTLLIHKGEAGNGTIPYLSSSICTKTALKTSTSAQRGLVHPSAASHSHAHCMGLARMGAMSL